MRISADYLRSIAEARRAGFIAAVITGLLTPFSWLYSGCIGLLSFLRSARRRKLPCAVISVGNITWGGTGKTPLVEFIALFLKRNGRNPAVLSRGYGASGGFSAGDEPLMLQNRMPLIPVLTDKKRLRSARKAMETWGADTLILDDGFQQWGISKDLDIVTVDAANPFGNGRVIPAGMLREPLSALKRADIFVLTRCEKEEEKQHLKNRLSSLNPRACIFCCNHRVAGFYPVFGEAAGVITEPEFFSGKEVVAFSGIAVPRSFERSLENTGARITGARRFPDHYFYGRREIEAIIAGCRGRPVVTTEKDAARLSVLYDGRPPAGIWVMRIELEFKNDDDQRLRDRLLGIYRS
ncbi:MAG: tetraacyldisaccharide 4'-kinase [Elusimicrobia bacterium]|nr:tetraacyldisaccharide 4'-kinase [Elusimicrobiota bacterium]